MIMTLIFEVKDSNRIHREVYVIIWQTVRDGKQITIANNIKVVYGLSVECLHLTSTNLKVEVARNFKTAEVRPTIWHEYGC